MADTRTLMELIPDEENVRTATMTDLDGLKDSIVVQGLIQPITIDPQGRIIAGHRRYAAISKGIEEGIIDLNVAWPVHIIDELNGDTGVRDRTSQMLVENMQRVDIDPFEQADAFGRMQDRFGLKQGEIAARIGKSASLVSSRLKLLKLPESVRRAYRAEMISLEQAEALVALADDEEAIEVALEQRWQVGRIESLVTDRKHKAKLAQVLRWIEEAGGWAVRTLGSIPDEAWPDGKEPTVGTTLFENPSKAQVKDAIVADEVYLATVDWEGTVRVGPIVWVKAKAKTQREVAHAEVLHEERKRKARQRAALRDAITVGGMGKGSAIATSLVLLPELVSSAEAQLACKFLGIPREAIPHYGDASTKLREMIAGGGRGSSQALTAVIAAVFDTRTQLVAEDAPFHGSRLAMLAELGIATDEDGVIVPADEGDSEDVMGEEDPF